jgi:hypothetical protein
LTDTLPSGDRNMSTSRDRFSDAYLDRLLVDIHREDVEEARRWQATADAARASPHLEITLKLAPDTPPGQAFLFATRMMAAIDRAVPDLGLTYDAESSHATNGTVVLALAPRNEGVDVSHLQSIAQVLHQELAGVSGMTLEQVSWEKRRVA